MSLPVMEMHKNVSTTIHPSEIAKNPTSLNDDEDVEQKFSHTD